MGILVIYVDKLRIVVPILQIHSNSFPFANMLLYIANAESPVILRDTARREGIIPSITGTELKENLDCHFNPFPLLTFSAIGVCHVVRKYRGISI